MKKFLCVFLCVLLFVPGICSAAATTQLSQQDLTRLDQIFQELSNNNRILLQSSTQSALELIQAQKELQQLRQELQELKELLVRLQAESIRTEQLLTSNNDSLTKANQFLAEEQKKINNKVNSLKAERTAWQIITGIAVGALVYTAAKK